MRRIKEKTKLAQGRCLGEGKDYRAETRAVEFSSCGTSVCAYDPIDQRRVELDSQGEMELFWALRFDDDVVSIKEHMKLDRELVASVCRRLGYRMPSHVPPTDMLVKYIDGHEVAYSVKYDINVFLEAPGRFQNKAALVRRLELTKIEKEYWAVFGIPYIIMLRSDMNGIYARNIENVMAFYDERFIFSREDMLKYLIAHKIIRVDMKSKPLCFPELLKSIDRIEERYEEALCLR